MKIKHIVASVAGVSLLAVGVLGGTATLAQETHASASTTVSTSRKSNTDSYAKILEDQFAQKQEAMKDAAAKDAASAKAAATTGSSSTSDSAAKTATSTTATTGATSASATSTNTTTTATSQSAAATSTATNTSTSSNASTTSSSTSTPATGFTIGGQTFGIRSFSGSGHVPADSNVYQWTGMSNHYLIERTGNVFGALSGVGVGSTVSVNGHSYTVRQILTNQDNTTNAAYDALVAGKAKWGGISFQTCEATDGYVRLYFAD